MHIASSQEFQQSTTARLLHLRSATATPADFAAAAARRIDGPPRPIANTAKMPRGYRRRASRRWFFAIGLLCGLVVGPMLLGVAVVVSDRMDGAQIVQKKPVVRPLT